MIGKRMLKKRVPIGLMACLMIVLLSVNQAWGEEVSRGCYGIKTSSMVSRANAHNAILAGEILKKLSLDDSFAERIEYRKLCASEFLNNELTKEKMEAIVPDENAVF
jgi:hypothetical protein